MLIAPTAETTFENVANYVRGVDPNAVVIVTEDLPLEVCTAAIEKFGEMEEHQDDG